MGGWRVLFILSLDPRGEGLKPSSTIFAEVARKCGIADNENFSHG